MATERQISANRQNAQRSTGPKTAEGKRAVAGNALKHGLLSRQVLIPGDDASTFAEMRDGVLEALEPVGELEELLVDRIVQGLWRLRRLGLVETGLFIQADCNFEAAAAKAEAERHTRVEVVYPMRDEFADLMSPRSTVIITNEAAHAAALERARQAAARMEDDVPRLGGAFVAKEGTLSALSRYEAAIERGVYKALHELQRLQAARAGHVVSPPIAADVDVALSVKGDGAGDPTKQM